jgi:hypothetical protein
MEEQVKRIIKIIIFALPNKYYKMAATEIAEKFCDTIYKNQDDIEKYPRKEIIEIVKNYLTNHLDAEDTEEQKQLIIKTILDKMANPFQTIFKSENVNLLLVNKYLEMDNVLKEVIWESVANMIKQQNEGEEKDEKKDIKKDIKKEEGKEEDEKVKLPYKTKSVGRSKISKQIVRYITGVKVDVTKKQETEGEVKKEDVKLPYETGSVIPSELESVNQSKNDTDNQSNTETDSNNQTGGTEQDALLAKGAEFANNVISGVNAASGMVGTLNNMPSSISLGTGTDSSPGSGSGSGSKHSDCCPLLDDNLLAMLKGIFTVDLLKGFYKEGAELTVDKINEQLSDVTKEPAVVKQEIYDKILEVFRAHLTSEEGREMIFKYINTIMEANIKQLTEEKEIAKQGFISILKHGSPEIKDIFESALDRVLFEKNLNELKAVNKDNIGDITESMRTEIKEFIIDKYKENTGKDISAAQVPGEIAEDGSDELHASAPVLVEAEVVQNGIPVVEVVNQATNDGNQSTNDGNQANNVPLDNITILPFATPVATNGGGAKKAKRYTKKQKRYTKKQKRFTKKQKRSRQTKRRQTKRRVNKSGRVKIHK